MWRTIAIYGAALALAGLLLTGLQYQLIARTHPWEILVGLIAVLFLGLGVWVGARLFGAAKPAAFAVNERARAALGVTDREFEVLRLLAAGRSNKEIARDLDVSANTVKTHIARLLEKLEAARRTEAILKARELGLIP